MKYGMIVPAVMAVGFLVSANAHARPDTRSMTCKQLQSFVEKQGGVVMNTGPRTYKRFVYHRGSCSYNQLASTVWVDASDGQCRLRECRGRATGKNSR